MKPQDAIKYLCGVMSLRAPQAKSLELFATYLQSTPGQKLLARMKRENRGNPQDILATTKEYFKSITEAKDFEEFERAFPAYTFALATGVGKTRLMGAFVAYLYLVYNIQHFLIVAPNLTIYRKLFDDFSKANNPKYVFKGVQELSTNNVKVITTDNYSQQRNASLFANQIEINIFNIQQFAQKDMTNERGITKAWETAGESYFDYLKEQNDLVVMLDEAHHYHADAALIALDVLDPLFGLEMTATPFTGNMVGRGANRHQEKMKNILYSYNLGDAIRGKLVKDPWIGTEADVDFSQFDQDSIDTDARKLQLAVYFHERAKNALKEYAIENNMPRVKPVMLVVAKNIDHSNQIKKLIDSDDFRGGEFKGKVIEINTRQHGEESDENIERLISLEHPDNIVEIVIHVNMLKEGWDVTNVYTIVPLREAAAAILTEQTIGRGLRLPYGERTGISLVDRLVLVAHEQFSKVVALAKDSSLIQGNVEQISEAETKDMKILTEVQPVILDVVKEKIASNSLVMSEVQKKVEEMISNVPQISVMDQVVVGKMIETKKEELMIDLAKQTIEPLTFSEYHNQRKGETQNFSFGSDTLFGSFSAQAVEELSVISKSAAREMESRNIPIPRLILTPHFSQIIINDFDLDTTKLRLYTNERSILEEQLQNTTNKNLLGEDVPGRKVTEITRISSFGSHIRQSPQSTIIAALLDFDLVDYDDATQRPLLLKLSKQAVDFYKKKSLDDNNLALIIETNARSIAEDIYTQILVHKIFKSEDYLESDVREPKPYLEEYNFSISLSEKKVSLDSQVDTFSAQYIYNQFKKACHSMYKFDSSDEVRLAYILDRDKDVEDWLRPAPNQFEGLYWRDEKGNSHHRYEPDFVVEFKDEITMIEVKPEIEIRGYDIQAKKQTADKYCEVVNKNIGKYGIVKPWRYVIITTKKITVQSTVKGLIV